MAAGFESVSAWQQPLPAPASSTRPALIETVAGQIAELSAGRLRVAVDGLTGTCKTSFSQDRYGSEEQAEQSSENWQRITDGLRR